ncbi:uncharacterized protein J7T54_004903 [Emericellopsis cladophorae]|uniref:HSF-type DNA-binding domain-containing protein n=1 Tax=Emericellopsis cladophorae TaxID=2686198 RepID=A0A9P9Y1F2_9HYPO|nr:uncharacterized protein J7T54_004903 [Emericellopsis cladophorae]KAI6781737.1 hypothetical protein J7T54_004903 [Emericellopsis cladophorae]
MASTAVAGDPMDIASPTSSSHRPDARSATDKTKAGTTSQGAESEEHENERAGKNTNIGNMAAPPPAAAALHQPKIVQTAFIHKLYNMLEDQNIQHLISWSSSADSFVMAPTPDFSKVLSQYFKHTNISSFVRQLNMYGFHKERDVFHTSRPESTLWEFKHGGGNFKRGDLVGLREIKRRASRHALVHRENNHTKPAVAQPGTPAEPLHLAPENTDTRLANLEYSLNDLSARLQRSDEAAHYMNVKYQVASDTIGRLLFFNQELARSVMSLVPPESQVHRDVSTLQHEMQRQVDVLRGMDDGPDPGYVGRQPYYGGMENPPVSPRQPQPDEARRGNLTVPQRQLFHQPAVPSRLGANARRPYGSIGGGTTTQSSPSRPQNPAAPPVPHPLSNVEQAPPGGLGRRHTSADIRAHGWLPGMEPQYQGGTPPAYPQSPNRVPNEDQRIRESFSTYSLQQAASQQQQQQQPPPGSHSRPCTPPFVSNGHNGADTFGNWSWGSAASRGLKDSSAPPTRRGSMAHILNPSDTAERSDEDECDEGPRGGEDDARKRKRMQ